MSINRSTYLEDEVDEAVGRIGVQRKWSISQTIAELLNESETLRKELRRPSASKRTAKPEPASNA